MLLVYCYSAIHISFHPSVQTAASIPVVMSTHRPERWGRAICALTMLSIRCTLGAPLVVQWLRLHTSKAGRAGLTPSWQNKILPVKWCGQKITKKRKKKAHTVYNPLGKVYPLGHTRAKRLGNTIFSGWPCAKLKISSLSVGREWIL